MPRSRIYAVILGALLAAIGPVASLVAQPQQGASGEVSLSAETFAAGTPVDLSTVLWRFREGDDPAWADPAFDDSAWALMDTDFQPDSLYPDV